MSLVCRSFLRFKCPQMRHIMMIHLGNVSILSTALQTPSFRKAIPRAYGSIQEGSTDVILNSSTYQESELRFTDSENAA